MFRTLLFLAFLGNVVHAADRPNVIFIAIDDLNDWIGCMKGHPQAHTPNMDRLAERGVLFTNAHCAAPVCLASRTAIFCGRYPHQTGVYSNWGVTKGKPVAKDLQLPMLLAANGYETLGTGKLYHTNARQLFNDYYDTEQRWSPFTRRQVQYTEAEQPSKATATPRHVIHGGPNDLDWVLPLNGLPSERNADTIEGESFDWGPVEVHDEEMGDVRITDWAIKKLFEPRSKPLFLGVGYYRPHIPLFAPQQDFDALPPTADIKLPAVLPNDLDDIGEQGKKTALDPITAGTHSLVVNNNQWKQATRAYLACVTFVDRQLGRLVDQLDSSAYSDNTWIILWSDHGWQLGEKEHWGKWTGWRQSTRVPLIIVPPRGQPAVRGRICGEPASLVDLFPTVLDICGLPKAGWLSGESLTPMIQQPEQSSGRVVLTSFDPGNYAISTRDWRLIRYQNGEEELYDIQNDASEWYNQATESAKTEILHEMRSTLDLLLQEQVTVP